MKKIYNQPACLIVELGTMQMIADSLPIGDNSQTITGQEQILTKENKDVNLWDNEW